MSHSETFSHVTELSNVETQRRRTHPSKDRVSIDCVSRQFGLRAFLNSQLDRRACSSEAFLATHACLNLICSDARILPQKSLLVQNQMAFDSDCLVVVANRNNDHSRKSHSTLNARVLIACQLTLSSSMERREIYHRNHPGFRYDAFSHLHLETRAS